MLIHGRVQAVPIHSPSGRSDLPPDPSEEIRRQGIVIGSEEFVQAPGDQGVDEAVQFHFSDDEIEAEERGERPRFLLLLRPQRDPEEFRRNPRPPPPAALPRHPEAGVEGGGGGGEERQALDDFPEVESRIRAGAAQLRDPRSQIVGGENREGGGESGIVAGDGGRRAEAEDRVDDIVPDRRVGEALPDAGDRQGFEDDRERRRFGRERAREVVYEQGTDRGNPRFEQ